MPKTVSLHTLGCKLNYSETSTIAKQFENNGFELKEYGDSSDVFVLNTCTVTENADKECRQIIRSVIRNNPSSYIIITGCYAQLQPEEIEKIEGVDLILGENEKFRIFDYVRDFERKEQSCNVIISSTSGNVSDFGEAFSADSDSRTRAFLKIQDGCDYNCAFCTIPLARGGSRSLEPARVIENAKKIIDSGYKEIILTGVNTGDYRSKDESLNEWKLINILYELEKTGIERIRISSIEPNLITDEILALYKSSSKFCNHFHIPLQSGDSDILKSMRRRYKNEFYKDLVLKLTEEIKDVGIGVDVIVGFPGETDGNFINTKNFLSALPIMYLHTFSYSERKNTVSVELPGKVEINKIKDRSRILRYLSLSKRYDFYSKHLNTNQEVLFESRKENGFIEGYTTNYIRVKVNTNLVKENNIYEVLLKNPSHSLMLSLMKGVEPLDAEIINT
jgi:threonylcarbamoyladenosine tRNA methylthiotransferase MtaB